MTALSGVAGNCTVYHLALKEMTQNLAKNALYVRAGAHNAVWAVCCFDFFPQLCDILCNYLRVQIVTEELCSFFCDLLYRPLECQLGIKC